MADTPVGTGPGGSWASNASPSQVAAALRKAPRTLVFTHMKPDGDAAGSTLAVVRALNLMPGHRAEAVFGGPAPAWLPILTGDTPVRSWERDGAPEYEPDAIVVIDTGSWTQLEIFRSYLAPRAARTIVIDHHRRGDAEVGALRWIDAEAAAVCQLAAGLCCLLLGVMPDGLPVEVASAAYLGLGTDTGWFRHSNVNSGVMNLAADLLDAGVNANELYQTVEQQDSLSRLHLMARALASLELCGGGRIGIMSLTRGDFAATGARSSETGGLIDLPQTIASVKVAALLTETDPAEYGLPAGTAVTKVSLRSKTDEIDVDQVCRTLGGGGHKRAAGAKVNATLAETRAKLLAALGA